MGEPDTTAQLPSALVDLCGLPLDEVLGTDNETLRRAIRRVVADTTGSAARFAGFHNNITPVDSPVAGCADPVDGQR